jgi:hypothetical protein
VIPAAQYAEIRRRLFYAKHWRIGTIVNAKTGIYSSI